MASPPSSPDRQSSPGSDPVTPARKPGRPDELGPYKRGFMEHHLVTYKTLVNARKKDTSLFITGVARAYVALFGLLGFKVEPLEDPGPSPSLDVTLEALHRGMDQLEIGKINEFTRQIRKKILSWFQNHNKRREQSGPAMDLQICLQALNNIFSVPPRPHSCRDMYIRERWDSHLNSAVQAAVAANPTIPPLTIRNRTITKCWASESPVYQAEIAAKTKAVNDREMEEHRLKAFKVSMTPEEYAQAWDDAEQILFPILECISVHFGVPFSFFWFGPDPHLGGKVRMRSMHSDVHRGQAGTPWSELPSFEAVRASGEEFSLRYWGGPQVPERAFSSASRGSPLEPGGAPSNNTTSQPIHSTADGNIDPLLLRDNPGRTLDGVSDASARVDLPNTPEQPPSLISFSPSFASTSSLDADLTLESDGFELAAQYDEVEALIPPVMDHSKDRLMFGRGLGSTFQKLLRALIDFEEAAGHMTTKYPSHPLRPAEIAYWHKCHRPKSGPKILPGFGGRLMEWWKAIQPPERVFQDGTLLRLSTCEWADYDVFRCGQYGITLFVIALAWFGKSINITQLDASSDDYKLWYGLAIDVTWALEQMITLAPLLSMDQEEPVDDEVGAPMSKRVRRSGSNAPASQPMKPASKSIAKPLSKRKRT